MNIHWNSSAHDQFILHGMWMYTKTDYTYWAEINMLYGSCLGAAGGPIINICPSGYDVTQPHAYHMWADSNGQQYTHFIGPWTVNSGTWEDYQIQRNPSNICDYFVWLNGNKVGTSTVQYCPGGFSYGYEVDVGLEHNYGNYDPDFYSNTDVDSNLETWHDGAWALWEYNYSWNGNEPCNGNLVTDCYNGETGGPSYQWITNRPWGG